jgi:hypothetical protein
MPGQQCAWNFLNSGNIFETPFSSGERLRAKPDALVRHALQCFLIEKLAVFDHFHPGVDRLSFMTNPPS